MLATKDYTDANVGSINSIRLNSQTIDAGVSVGNLVAYNPTSSMWYKTGEGCTGIYVGNNDVVIKGLANGLTGLIAGSFYYTTSTGDITSDINQAYNKTKVGFALSTTQLLVDIDIEGSYYTSQTTGVNGTGNLSTGAYINNIDYVIIDQPGNAMDFGDMTNARRLSPSASNGSDNRAVWYGGESITTMIDYVTISTPGNAAALASLPSSYGYMSATSNSVNQRGVCSTPYPTLASNNIFYHTINTTGNAAVFGSLTYSNTYAGSATSNGVNNRGIFYGDRNLNGIIHYITISTLGNSVNFGNNTFKSYHSIATSNNINNRGLLIGGAITFGGTPSASISYITINSPSNATSYGNLFAAMAGSSAASNGVRNRGLVFGGWAPGPIYWNNISYFNITTLGDMNDFGDLDVPKASSGASSNAY